MIEDEPYYEIEVTFRQEGGGRDYQDRFHLLVSTLRISPWITWPIITIQMTRGRASGKRSTSVK